MEIRNLTIGITAFLVTVFSTQAVEFLQTNQFVIAEDEVMQEETWVSSQGLAISGSVSNDLFISTSEGILNGTFFGDVWCAADSITNAGIFHDSARILARIVQVQGTHYGPVLAAGTTVKIDRSAVLYGDLLCLGENVILEGSVSGKVRILAQRVTLGGQFRDDVSIAAQEIVVLPGTVLNGNLAYQAPNEVVLGPSVILGGEMTRRFKAIPTRHLFKENLGSHFMFALAALVTGLVFIALFPRYTGTALLQLHQSRGLCSLAGFAGLVVLPLAAFILLLTLVGLPLSILIFLFYFILLYLSKIMVALWIGSALLRRKEFNRQKTAAPLAIGLLVVYTLTSISAAEMLIQILIMIWGLGALLIALFKRPVLILQTPDSITEINKEG